MLIFEGTERTGESRIDTDIILYVILYILYYIILLLDIMLAVSHDPHAVNISAF